MTSLVGILVAIAVIWLIIVLVAHLPVWLLALIVILVLVGVVF